MIHPRDQERIDDKQYLLLKSNLIQICKAGAPTDGTSGTGAGEAGPGCLCTDTSNTELYINTGTLASPVWILVGTQY